ncbi:D-alanyl-D-alanine carboxypeptidase [Escherichia coli]
MIADTVFRTIGHARFNVPGTWRLGSDAVRQILRQQAVSIWKHHYCRWFRAFAA